MLFWQFGQTILVLNPFLVFRPFHLLTCLLDAVGNLPKAVICDDDKTLKKSKCQEISLNGPLPELLPIYRFKEIFNLCSNQNEFLLEGKSKVNFYSNITGEI